eukprot:TRINITY_DN6950_c0_g1_i1.p1 TRINITY_DN6950_c0_g1~~TRINITY_DN6950_c0_g1_i1.p1  ORF type:complete len:650 (+),score=133.70 TRINITY_DN6950_c0_g1_i1:79-2028(+)
MSNLATERKNASFELDHLTEYLYGEEEIAIRAKYHQMLQSNPLFDRSNDVNLSREQLYELGLKRSHYLITEGVQGGVTRNTVLSIRDTITGLHKAMFMPCIQGQGSPEQIQKWIPLAEDYQIIGTYAQTELGHGTFLRGLETTATYIPETQEFIMHTPTDTARKWWPGNLAKIATHAIVMAKLILHGTDYGVHAFIVQLRSLEDHSFIPGVTTGDIGAKYGWNDMANGWLCLDNVRIPRDQMLMKFSAVSPDGDYVEPVHAKLSYGTMIHVRALMLREISLALSKALTISIRYSCVRSQGFKDRVGGKGKETYVMDYGTQQNVLTSLLADTYAMYFTSVDMQEAYLEFVRSLDLSELANIHATSSGLKAMITWMSSRGIEECRQRCGGHGYLAASGIPEIFTATVPACTYEGDNLVLVQQTTRHLLKNLTKALNGEDLTGDISYLNLARSLSADKSLVVLPDDLLNSEIQIRAFEHKAARVLLNVNKYVRVETAKGTSSADIWNGIMGDFVDVTRSHCDLIMLKGFVKKVEQCSNPEVRRVLKKLCDLFALTHLYQDRADLLVDNYFDKHTIYLLQQNRRNLIRDLRPELVSLVDAFDHHDLTLNSALGRHDGKVYEALIQLSRQSPLNQQDVISGYKEYIQPILKGKL